MKVIYILGLSRCGSTKYGEFLCEKQNKQGIKTLFLGEVSYSFKPRQIYNISQLYCSCGKKKQ